MPRNTRYAPTHREGVDKDGKPLRGRTKVEWPPVPNIAQYRIDAVGEWVSDHRNVRRAMTVTTPLLAIICALYEKNHPLPTRRVLAESLDCNIFSIDAAISTALGEGEVTEEYRYEEGGVSARASIRRRRYVLPSKQLYDVYSSAEYSRSGATRAQPMKLVG